MNLTPPLTLLCAFFPLLSLAQEKPTLTELVVCHDASKTVEACNAEELSTKKTFLEAEREVYTEYYNQKGALVGVSVTAKGGVLSSCGLFDGQMSCEYIDLMDQAGLVSSKKKSAAPRSTHSDKELARALGAEESSVSMLGIDWRFSQVVVWAVKAPQSKGFAVSPGEVSFVTTKGNAGELLMPYFESCPQSGASGQTSAPPVKLIAALLPIDFSVNAAKATLEKAGFSASRCTTKPHS